MEISVDYKLLMGLYYPVLWVFTSNSKAKDFAKQINYGGKVLMFKEVQLICYK
jgi:hypothetical protein